MKVCPKCGKTFDKDYLKFCDADGTKLVDYVAPVSVQPAAANPPSVATGNYNGSANVASSTARAAAADAANMISDGFGRFNITSDGYAIYLPSVVLQCSNVSEILLTRDAIQWKWAIILGVAGLLFLCVPLIGVQIGLVLLLAAAIVAICMYMLAQKAVVFAMNSGDRVKVILHDEEELRKIYPSLCLSVLQHAPCSISLVDAKLEISKN